MRQILETDRFRKVAIEVLEEVGLFEFLKKLGFQRPAPQPSQLKLVVKKSPHGQRLDSSCTRAYASARRGRTIRKQPEMIEERLQFEDFTIDRGAHELRRGGVLVPLQRIPLKLLCLLVERHGQLVTRDEILERVWGKGVFVDSENAINTAVRKLRRALCDDSDAPRFVVTVPASGYRFIAKTREPTGLRVDLSQVQAPQNPMVGREREMASLLAGLEHAAIGRGSLFLISGEPGVGKTRLAQQLAAAAHARRFAVLSGNCSDQDEEAVPYLPFVEILESCVDRATDGLPALLGEQGPELARLLPRLRRMLPDLAAPLDLPPQQSRRHLFHCFCDFVARLAREQPLLLILEDLHWADDSSLSLLDHLAHRISASPIVIAGTYRNVGLNLTRELAKTLENFFRSRLAVGIKLKGFPRSEVGEMLEALSGQAPPAAVVGEIHGETDGNPFFIEELFRHLEEENLLYDDQRRFRIELFWAETGGHYPRVIQLAPTGRAWA